MSERVSNTDNLPAEQPETSADEKTSPTEQADRLVDALDTIDLADLDESRRMELLDLASRVADSVEKLNDRVVHLEEVVEQGTEYETGWLAGMIRAFDVLPSRGAFDRWVAEVGAVREKLDELATAERIIRRATGGEQDGAGS